MVAVLVGNRVDEQVRVIFQVVLGPHHLMPGNLLRRQDGLLDRGQRRNLSQFAELHILQALRVLRQAHDAHAPLDAVHEPTLRIHRHDGDVAARNVAYVLQHLGAGEQVLADTLALYLALPFLGRASGRQPFLKFRVVLKVRRAVPLLAAVQQTEDADGLGLFLDPVVLGNEHDIRREPVKLGCRDVLGHRGRRVIPLGTERLGSHRGQHESVGGVCLVLPLGV